MLTQPAMLGGIQPRFLEAGAHIIEPNAFWRHDDQQSEFFVDDRL